jgi:ribonuclease Z
MQISKLFITHFHGDHFLGLPGLIQTMQLNDREEPLYIYGPKDIKYLVSKLLDLGYFKVSYKIIVKEVKDCESIDFKDYKIKVINVDHGIPAVAYSLEEKMRPGKFNKNRAIKLCIPEGPLYNSLQHGKSIILEDGRKIEPEMVLGNPRKGRKIVISGDTRSIEKMITFTKDADILIHDSTFSSDLEDIAYKYGHSTSLQSAKIAKKAKVKYLFLTHISPRYNDCIEMIKEAKKIFKNVIIPNDFEEFEVRLVK